MHNPLIRYATPEDVPAILQLVRELAAYEHAADQVVTTEDMLLDELFEKRHAEVILAEVAGDVAGFALFFHNFSTWLGQAGIYLEDLFVRPAYRKQGLGRALLQRLAAIAVERNCGRLEWACLDWNQPSIDFYLSLGAQRMDEWTTYRVTGATLEARAREGAAASAAER